MSHHRVKDPSGDILAYLKEHKSATSMEIQYDLNRTPRYHGLLSTQNVGMRLKTLHGRGLVECIGRTSSGRKVWKLTEVSA